MIHLAFRYRGNFEHASSLLAGADIQFHSEAVREEIGDSRLYFFEEELQTDARRRALSQARSLERNDRREQRRCPLPNLAIPCD